MQSRKVIMAKIRPQWPNQLMQSGANCWLAAACTSGCLFRCHSPKTFVLWPQSIDFELLHYMMGAICEALGVAGQIIQRGRTEGNVLWSQSVKKGKQPQTPSDWSGCGGLASKATVSRNGPGTRRLTDIDGQDETKKTWWRLKVVQYLPWFVNIL